MATKKASTEKKSTSQPETVRYRLVELQKRSLATQHKAFDRTYEAVESFRERSEDQVNEWLKSARFVPSEVAELAAEWTSASRSMRSTYKKTVDNSFAIAESWVDGLATA